MAGLTAAARELMALAPAVGRYGAACGTGGAVAGLLSPHLGLPPVTAFSFGFLLPLGPLVWWCNRPAAVRRELDTWKAWEEAKVVTQAEARTLRRITLRAMTRQRYGAAAGGPEEFG